MRTEQPFLFVRLKVARSAADVQAGALPGGAIVVGLHAGPYDQLGDTYAAMERWMEANGYRPSGSPWESYVTDLGDVPDTKDWRTEVYWRAAMRHDHLNAASGTSIQISGLPA